MLARWTQVLPAPHNMRSEYTLRCLCLHGGNALDLKYIINEKKNLPGKRLFRKWKSAATWRSHACHGCPMECKINQLSEMAPDKIGLLVLGSSFIE